MEEMYYQYPIQQQVTKILLILMDEKKKKFQSIFSRDRPRAIYRESDEYRTEEPPSKISFSDAIETQPLQSLQDKLSTLTQEWKPNITLITAQFQPPASPLAKTKTQQFEKATSEENSPVSISAQTAFHNVPDKKHEQSQYIKTIKSPLIQQIVEHQSTINSLKQAQVFTTQYQQQPYQQIIQKHQVLQSQPAINIFQQNYQPSSIQQPLQPQQPIQSLQQYQFSQVNQNQIQQKPSQSQQQQQFIQNQQQKQQTVSKSKVFNVNGIKYIGLRPLGSGGSATVYQTMTPDLQQFALKVIDLKDENDELCGKKAIISEIQILEKLKGKGITLDIQQYQFTETQGYIVLQLGDIDLRTYLKQNIRLSKAKVLSLVEDMAETTMQMHQCGFIHGDLKPHNYMFYQAKLVLIDFGISKEMQSQQTTVIRDSLSGTPKYMAPEVIRSQYGIKGARIHRASDVWSIGCILYEMACGRSPFDQLLKQTKTPLVFIQRLKDGDFTIDFSCIQDTLLKNLAIQMLSIDDNSRISLEEVLKILRN
ncbi:Kinase, TTK [Spironucleus salmonicida]|uniref:Kinase, TTK n=1 Tax=Spironucleus salmonicida TaxID=348837 RepID=V6LS05_9EUKA|nr:Kinase, TTK [Spironucleus salmonicida]|eukprot:EST47442.1 Kinase, TTK [Spironucleus salmonicida]